MKKFKKLIAVMLAAVLFAGTFMSDMGTKEVKATGEYEDFLPDEEYGPIGAWLWMWEDELYPGDEVEFELEVLNNVGKDNQYTTEFFYVNMGERTDTTATTYFYDEDADEYELIDSISDVTITPGEYGYFLIEWTVPDDWEEGKSQFVVKLSDGTNVEYAAVPGRTIGTYEPGDICISDVEINPAFRDDIQFAGSEKRKVLPVDITVETSSGWEMKEADLTWYSLEDGSAGTDQDDVVKVGSDDGKDIYRVNLEINKYMMEDRYGLEHIMLVFEKQAEFDLNYDQVVDETDIEEVCIYYNTEGNFVYEGDIDITTKLPVTEEAPVIMEGEDDYGNELEGFTYHGQADFTITKSVYDEDYPKLSGLEILTDTDNMGVSDNVTVKLDWEEVGSGLEYIELEWANIEGDSVRTACWMSEDMEEVLGKGTLELTTEDFDYRWDGVWEPEGEYYIKSIYVSDWAGNWQEYETYYGIDNQKLISYEYKYNEVTDDFDEIVWEIPNVSFSRGDKHAYVPMATKASERADAKKKTNGKAPKQCENCGKTTTAKGTIYYPKYYDIYDSVYTGEQVGCYGVEVYDSKDNEIHPSYFDYEYIDNATTVGLHKVKITFKGNYKGEVTKSYAIMPAAVTGMDAEVSGGHNDVKITWEPSKGADGYYVYWAKQYVDEDGYEYEGKSSSKKSTSKTSYTVKDLSSDQLYGFYVIPYFKKNDKKYFDYSQYNYVECKTKKNIKAPESVTAKLNGEYNDVALSWKSSKNADGYNVYYKLGSGEYELLDSTTELKTDKAVDLNDGGKYTFRVVPYYMDGDETIEGAYGKTSTVYILKAVKAPKVTRSSSKVKVSWTNISGESGYEISKSEDPTVDGTITTYKTTSGKSKTISAKKGVTYYYKVRAYKTVNGEKIYGPWSEVTEYTRKK